MAQRLQLQILLKEILGSDDVYFQPPSNVQMSYPAIVYMRQDVDMRHANNKPYKNMTLYQVTYIDRNPDGETDVCKKLEELPHCSYDRFFAADDLNHDVYNLYF